MASVEQSSPTPLVADPAPLGLAAFALTTFLLSGHNATLMPDAIWVGVGAVLRRPDPAAGRDAGVPEPQRVRGDRVLDLRRLLAVAGSVRRLDLGPSGFAGLLKGADVDNSLAWFLISFAIFNAYMLLASLA